MKANRTPNRRKLAGLIEKSLWGITISIGVVFPNKVRAPLKTVAEYFVAFLAATFFATSSNTYLGLEFQIQVSVCSHVLHDVTASPSDACGQWEATLYMSRRGRRLGRQSSSSRT